MKAFLSTLFTLLLAMLLPVSAHAELRVVTSTPDLAAIASAVGGARVKVKALALPTQDPHWVDARPNLALELSKADLLLAVGAELEIGWLPTLQVGSRNGKVQKGAPGYLECSDLVDLLERPAGKVDRSMGDIHPTGNPHYMLDPRLVEKVAVGVARRMSELDPEGKSAYLEQATRFVKELRAARAKWEERLKEARGREIVTYHRSLIYLANWLGLSLVDEVESRPGVPPNPSHVAELIAKAKQRKLRAIVQESYYPTNTSELIAQKVGAKVVRLPGGTNFQSGQTYIAFMNQVVSALERAL
jgi:zinc/manganese transport system substrate-binding protein